MNKPTETSSYNYRIIAEEIYKDLGEQFRAKPILSLTIDGMRQQVLSTLRTFISQYWLTEDVLVNLFKGSLKSKIDIVMQQPQDIFARKGFAISLELDNLRGDINIQERYLEDYTYDKNLRKDHDQYHTN